MISSSLFMKVFCSNNCYMEVVKYPDYDTRRFHNFWVSYPGGCATSGLGYLRLLYPGNCYEKNLFSLISPRKRKYFRKYFEGLLKGLGTRDGHRYFKKCSLPKTLHFLCIIDYRAYTWYKICLRYLEKGSLPKTLHFLCIDYRAYTFYLSTIEPILYVKICHRYLEKGSLPKTLHFLFIDYRAYTFYLSTIEPKGTL